MASRRKGSSVNRVVRIVGGDEQPAAAPEKQIRVLKTKSQPPRNLVLPEDSDIQLAAEVQSHLLPSRVPVFPGYEFDAYYNPAHEVGGDYYDFIVLGKGLLGMVMADAVGKGMSGALIMVETRALVRAYSAEIDSPAEILRKVNSVLYRDLQRGMFISLYYARLDLKKRKINCACAGHMPLLVAQRDKRCCIPVRPKGAVLGALSPSSFNRTLEEDEVELNEGDRFLLYTDGATEERDEAGFMLGSDRFMEALVASSDRPSSDCIHHLIGTIKEHRGKGPAADDISLITGRLVSEADIKRLSSRGKGKRK